MTQFTELNEKHAALIQQVREIRDAHKDQDMPADKAAEMEHRLDEADAVKAQLEALVSAAEAKRRLDDHSAWATQSAGQLSAISASRTNDGALQPLLRFTTSSPRRRWPGTNASIVRFRARLGLMMYMELKPL